MSLAASDAEELLGSTADPAPLLLSEPSDVKPGIDTDLFCVPSKAAWSGLLLKNPPAAVWTSGSCQGVIESLIRDPDFFLEDHDELNRSLCALYSACLHTFTSVDGAEDKGYEKLILLDESMAIEASVLALASVKHMGDLQALSVSPNCLEFGPGNSKVVSSKL